jgi:hypothetical protein
MNKLRKALWFSLGLILLAVAYIGVITPGIPWSTPSVGAAYCFAKSNERWHRWLMNHKLFGLFLTNWQEKRVFPTKGKWMMVITMDVSLVILVLTTQNILLVVGVGLMMLIVCTWAWRFPGSVAEYQRRQEAGEPLGWFK